MKTFYNVDCENGLDIVAMKKYAQERYDKVKEKQGEILVSGSDDLTLYMW